MTRAQALALKPGDSVTHTVPVVAPATVVQPLVAGNHQVQIKYTQTDGVTVTNFVHYSYLT